MSRAHPLRPRNSYQCALAAESWRDIQMTVTDHLSVRELLKVRLYAGSCERRILHSRRSVRHGAISANESARNSVHRLRAVSDPDLAQRVRFCCSTCPHREISPTATATPPPAHWTAGAVPTGRTQIASHELRTCCATPRIGRNKKGVLSPATAFDTGMWIT